jgi:hypothetical protein
MFINRQPLMGGEVEVSVPRRAVVTTYESAPLSRAIRRQCRALQPCAEKLRQSRRIRAMYRCAACAFRSADRRIFCSGFPPAPASSVGASSDGNRFANPAQALFVPRHAEWNRQRRLPETTGTRQGSPRRLFAPQPFAGRRVMISPLGLTFGIVAGHLATKTPWRPWKHRFFRLQEQPQLD